VVTPVVGLAGQYLQKSINYHHVGAIFETLPKQSQHNLLFLLRFPVSGQLISYELTLYYAPQNGMMQKLPRKD